MNKALEPHRLHFGYRTRNEVLRFVEQAGDESLLGEGAVAKAAARDLQLLQKVLPKLSGSRDQLQRPLRQLLGIAMGADAEVMGQIGERYEELYAALLAPGSQPGTASGLAALEPAYPRTARKVARMLLELKTVSYSSYFE